MLRVGLDHDLQDLRFQGRLVEDLWLLLVGLGIPGRVCGAQAFGDLFYELGLRFCVLRISWSWIRGSLLVRRI